MRQNDNGDRYCQGAQGVCQNRTRTGGFSFHGIAGGKIKGRSAGGIARWTARSATKSALEKISKDEQRWDADQPHPILELDAGEGVVVEQKSRDLFPHIASLRPGSVEASGPKERPRRIGGAKVGRPCWEGRHK